jgi:NAD(P)-dependent dehydrogenase (short-subunit alcohol dehydrogenase family)
MDGKVVMITGGTGGIGYFTAQEIARMGATVIIIGRDLSRCIGSVQSIQHETGNPNVSYLLADLASLDQVRAIARTFLEEHDHLDVLINNAGVANLFRKRSADDYEVTFAVNHLAHFLLTNLLLPALRASPSARVINVSSGAHYNEQLDFNNLQLTHGYNPWKAYGRSKLANILFTYELARRMAGDQITSNALTPGMVATDMWKKVHPLLTPFLTPFIQHYGQTPLQGAQTSIYLATSPDVEGITGQYYAYLHPINSSPASHEATIAQRLWEVSEQLVGLDK